MAAKHNVLFDTAIEQLAAETTLQDPQRLLTVLDSNPQATALQLNRLWEVAANQTALAEVQVASDEGTLRVMEWAEEWSHAAQVLRKTITDIVPNANIEDTLSTYWEESRALRAFPPFILRLRRVESLLQGQRSLLGFHHDVDENAYRQREAELSAHLATPETAEADRLSIATRLVEECTRYQHVYLPKLEEISREIAQAFRKCEPLLPFFSARHHPEVHRWYQLTSELLEARNAALAHVRHMLAFDAFLPKEVIAGATRVLEVDGKKSLMLSESGTQTVGKYLEESASLVAKSAHKEQQIEAERDSCTRQIIGDPEEEEPRLKSVPPVRQRQHPIERRAWFRVARLTWWGALALWLLLVLSGSRDPSDLVFSTLVGVVVLYGIKAAVFYVILGRTSLREPPGSGFVDLDTFEEEVFERSADRPDDELRRAIDDFRKRYGRRVPAEVLREFVDTRLSNIRKEKRRILADADKQDTTIRIDNLRASIMRAYTANLDRDAYRLYCERYLLRLEVKYGSEIPVSVVDEEADALAESANVAGTS